MLQSLLVDRLDAEEHVAEAELRPAREHLAVTEQDVGARLQVVALADLPPFDLVGDRQPVLGANERDVVDDEHVRLRDAR